MTIVQTILTHAYATLILGGVMSIDSVPTYLKTWVSEEVEEMRAK